MSKRNRRQLTDEEKASVASGAGAYWVALSKEVTGNALFVDSSAVLDYHDYHPTKHEFRNKVGNFLDTEASSYRYITSTYVVAEIVRKIIHPSANNDFRGHGGTPLAPKPLACWVVGDWLRNMNIRPLCVPMEVFERGKANLEKHRARNDLTGWTLTDALSYEIVVGLGHKTIVSADRDFMRLGLTLLPF